MPFSKSEMQEELFAFLSGFGSNVAQLYGMSNHAWTSREAIEATPFWQAVNEMYDFGVMGIPSEELYPQGHFYGLYAELERFLLAIDTQPMESYLKRNKNKPPRLALRAVQTAVARMVLEDGWRENDHGGRQYGTLKGDMNHLTLAEVALLANMDERSVRNAANPKLPDPLKTELNGSRTMVRPQEARRWLAGRKSFIPTRPYTGTRKLELNIDLSTLIPAEQIQKILEEAGVLEFDLDTEKLAEFLATMKKAPKS